MSSPTGGGVLPWFSTRRSSELSPNTDLGQVTGNVDFFLCQPATVTANGGDCAAGGARIGATKTLPPTSPPAHAGTATSDATTNTTTVGTYCWRAENTPDASSQQ